MGTGHFCPRGAVAGIAADVAQEGGVALLSTTNEIGLADERAQEDDVYQRCQYFGHQCAETKAAAVPPPG